MRIFSMAGRGEEVAINVRSINFPLMTTRRKRRRLGAAPS